MNTYEIRITNTSDHNVVRTIQATAEDIDTLSDNIETIANYAQEIELHLEDGTVLEVSQHSEHGYNANLYASRDAFENGDDPIGGGLCTGTPADAIEMAITNR